MHIYRLDVGCEDGSTTYLYSAAHRRSDGIFERAVYGALEVAMLGEVRTTDGPKPHPPLHHLGALTIGRLAGSEAFDKEMADRGFTRYEVAAAVALYSLDRPLGDDEDGNIAAACYRLRERIEALVPGLRARVQKAKRAMMRREIEGVAKDAAGL